MAPIWHSYFGGVRKVMYVIDAINLTQLGEATLLLMDLLSHPRMRASQVQFPQSLEGLVYKTLRIRESL